MRHFFYFADYDGYSILVTPWPMMQNAQALVELTSEQLSSPHYAALKQDAEHFYSTAGENAAVLLYDLGNVPANISENHPSMIASFWLRGPLAGNAQDKT